VDKNTPAVLPQCFRFGLIYLHTYLLIYSLNNNSNISARRQTTAR